MAGDGILNQRIDQNDRSKETRAYVLSSNVGMGSLDIEFSVVQMNASAIIRRVDSEFIVKRARPSLGYLVVCLI